MSIIEDVEDSIQKNAEEVGQIECFKMIKVLEEEKGVKNHMFRYL